MILIPKYFAQALFEQLLLSLQMKLSWRICAKLNANDLQLFAETSCHVLYFCLDSVQMDMQTFPILTLMLECF